MDIKFDQDNLFLGIPKDFFTLSQSYKPRRDEGSTGIRNIIKQTEKYPLQDENFSEDPFYKYPEYQHAVLTFIANFAEKHAYECNTSADELFNEIFLKIIKLINRNKNNDTYLNGYEANTGKIYLGSGRLYKLCKNVLAEVGAKSKGGQLRQTDGKREYVYADTISIDEPLNDPNSEDAEIVFGDLLTSDNYIDDNKDAIIAFDDFRKTIPEGSEERYIADEIYKRIKLGFNDLKHEWNDIAQGLGYEDGTVSKFRTKRNHLAKAYKKYIRK